MSLACGLAALRAENDSPEFDLALVTKTPRADFNDNSLPFRTVRQPGIWQLWKLVREADVVHLAGPALAPMVLGLIARKAVVVEHHGFQVICPTGQLLIERVGEPCPGHFMTGRWSECWKCDPELGWFAARKLWLLTFVRRWLCQRVVVVNIMPTNWLDKQLQLPRATTIHHGVESIQPSRDALAKGPDTLPSIVFQGRLVSTKGAGILLEAAKVLASEGEDFEIVIIGDGPARPKLEATAKDPALSGRVRFVGRLAPDELEKVLGCSTMVVVPSLGGEVFGLVVAENMRRGLPVIASDLGAFVEVLGPAGASFSCGNAGELAARIREFLSNPEATRQTGQRGRQRASELFSLAKMIQRHASVFRSLR